MKKLVICLSLFTAVAWGQGEVIGDEGGAPRKETVNEYSGFGRGSHVITPGLLYGSSLIGVDYEFGITRFLGIQIGGGFVGADAGVNIHILPKKNFDMFFVLDGNFLPGLGVFPGLNLGMRGLFGDRAKVGIAGEIGFMVSTVDRNFEAFGQKVGYKKGDILLNFAIGVPIRIR